MTSLADFQPAGKRQRKRGKKEERRREKKSSRGLDNREMAVTACENMMT